VKIEKLFEKELSDSIVEVRRSTEDYEELVFLNKDLAGWNRVLTETFGVPVVSPDGIGRIDPSSEIVPLEDKYVLDLTFLYGGIREGQTLYYSRFDSFELLIMIWPWQDDAHQTLKKIILR